ncbi:glycosyltransferase family 2 protein [Flavobacterium aquatile]|nr:glycosyltransferase [Flavobacterium aquatile]
MSHSTKFSLIICTYMRAKALLNLLNSIRNQSVYPDEIIIVDGSTNDKTQEILEKNNFVNLIYYKVDEQNRGLTKQRNFGISKVGSASELVCFLDDDTILEQDYFEKIITTFIEKPDAIGVGGVAINENKWKINSQNITKSDKFYILENYYIKESSRNYLRNLLGLGSNKMPGVMPEFSHGKTCSYPLNQKTYPVDLLVGMAMNFRKSLFDKITFSTYFEGYGLYEDADFSLRALKFGQNYINTSAKLSHYHDSSGRPNKYNYGKMVLRNGWYVWRIKYPNPTFNNRVKWNAIALLLIIIRFSNTFTTTRKKEAFTESVGRIVGWFSLLYNKPSL